MSDPPRRELPPPRVAVVIPILNEAKTLGDTLGALLEQDYPDPLYEILVVDGGSSDGWREVLTSLNAERVHIRVLLNYKRSTPAALNLALASTDADAILWISGHCVLSPNYISTAARTLAERPGQVVGGRLLVRGEGVRGRLNAMVLSSRFGTGMAPLRFEARPGATQSVTFALYDRRQLQQIGGLDERFMRNQDNDLWNRLRQTGASFRRVDAVATYLAPPTFAGLWRRAWENGSWNIWSQRLRKGGLNWWHFAPMAMVGGGVLLTVVSLWVRPARLVFLALVAVYAALAIASAWSAARTARAWWAMPILPFLFLIHHAIYGMGSWVALLRPVPTVRRGVERQLEPQSPRRAA
jgi:succinoglycan biosynthesis protein ExoA